MSDQSRLLTLKEVSKILNLNTEVLRRWLRNKKIPGVKVGSDWRVREEDLNAFLNQGNGKDSTGNEQPPAKMCFRFPKWLEYSGLPMLLNEKIGPQGWPVFKKLIELDFEMGKPKDRLIEFALEDLSERVGYTTKLVQKTLEELAKLGYVEQKTAKKKLFVKIVTPVKTPRLVLDISFEKGGVKGAPTKALENNCLRRLLEV
jgi:excisionase family DNA binding protein